MKQALLDSLRRGGYILYVRHGEATVGEDLPVLDFQNCLTQRNLSEQGRRQAIFYGDILRYYRIPIRYPVAASPFCRTIETAQLAFGRCNVQVEPFWLEVYRLSGNLPSRDRMNILKNIQCMLETIPEQGKNQVIVAQSFPEGVGLGPIPDMGTVIIKPRGLGNGFQVVGRLSLSDLASLV